MDELTGIVARAGFLPHGYCFQWSPGLLWTMVSSDLAIALAYFSIPLVIASYARRRPQVNLGSLATLFAVFIFACGITHLMDVWTIWRPDYALQTGAKAVTAIASVLTAAVAWRLMPTLLALPSAQEMQAANQALRDEVAGGRAEPGGDAGGHRCRLRDHRRRRPRHAHERRGRAHHRLARGRGPGPLGVGGVRARRHARRAGATQPGGRGARARA
jgi:hypothetical protein